MGQACWGHGGHEGDAKALRCPQRGREGVEEDWEKTDDFHQKWKVKSMDVLAQAEWRKRKLNQRVRNPRPSFPPSPQLFLHPPSCFPCRPPPSQLCITPCHPIAAPFDSP